MRRSLWRPATVALLQLAAAVVAVFVLTSLLPGDTAVVILGEHATQGQLAPLRQHLGLDQPPGARFLDWLSGLFRGDLGTSLLTGTPVAEEIGRRFATTALLAIVTLAIALPLAVGLGIFSGLCAGSRTDRTLTTTVVVLHSVPEFALGLLLAGALSVSAGWLPATAAGASGWSLALQPAVLVMPVAVLVVKQLCVLARQVRTGVIEAADAEHAVYARLLGMSEQTVVARHILPNALAPAVQQLARALDGLLGGVLIVESLFALPGMGSGFVEAVRARDLPVVQGYAIVFAATTVVVNLFADLVVTKLVPQGSGRP